MPIDLGQLDRIRYQRFQAKVTQIVGENPKENVKVACQAEDLLEAGRASSADEAVQSAASALGATPTPDDVQAIIGVTSRALAADASTEDMAQAAMTWTCLWAG